jgi:hypothetical protein
MYSCKRQSNKRTEWDLILQSTKKGSTLTAELNLSTSSYWVPKFNINSTGIETLEVFVTENYAL